MPVRKFHSVEAMSTDHDKPAGVAAGDLRAAVRISLTCLALDGRRPPAGVYKYRSASEAWQTRRRWELALER